MLLQIFRGESGALEDAAEEGLKIKGARDETVVSSIWVSTRSSMLIPHTLPGSGFDDPANIYASKIQLKILS